MENDGRDEQGRFVPGNAGGPGRLRRPVEREFLVGLSDRLTLEAWGMIVDRAIEQAQAGDARAREWLSRYALGEQPLTLTGLAVREMRDFTTDLELRAEAQFAGFRLRSGKVALMDDVIDLVDAGAKHGIL